MTALPSGENDAIWADEMTAPRSMNDMTTLDRTTG
jgi:hypothetical protein